METQDIGRAAPEPWVPTTDVAELRILGKLGEETNELGAATARCIIQGVDGVIPGKGKLNRDWLADEIADVMASSQLAIDKFGLNVAYIQERMKRKIEFLSAWHQHQS